jgi:hypothetical protein
MTTMMASKDDKKRKYATDGAKEEAEEAPLKKQKMISGDDNDGDHDDDGDDHDDDGDDHDDSNGNDSSASSSSPTDDDYSSEPEEEMNIPTGSEGELLIRRGCCWRS